MLQRRQALVLIPIFLLSFAARRYTVHPTPRRGITSAKVLPASQLRDVDAEVVRIFDMVREIPQIVDGIYCHCGCSEMPDHYSLLSCYEADAMAQVCVVCQGEARLAYQLHKQGRSLDDIRAAIDRSFA